MIMPIGHSFHCPFTDSKFPLESVIIVGLVVSLTGIIVSAVAIVIGFIKSKR